MSQSKKGLIITDVQNDFCPGGALAVPDGDTIVPVINSIVDTFDIVAATQDWHPKDHISFASNHEGKKPFEIITLEGIEQTLWPDHCVQGTKGAELHSDLKKESINLIIRKGANSRIDSYSTFLENDKKTITGLDGYFKSLDIDTLYLCGLATDFCVFFSAMDAADLGFTTYVIIDATRGIDVPKGNIDIALTAMNRKGIKIIKSSEL